MDIDQPKVSQLSTGQFHGYSSDRLIQFLTYLAQGNFESRFHEGYCRRCFSCLRKSMHLGMFEPHGVAVRGSCGQYE